MKADNSSEFPVASDGRVTIDVPRLPRGCSVYLFTRLRISRGLDPLTMKSLQLLNGGSVAASLSLDEIARLPSDAAGYHILHMNK